MQQRSRGRWYILRRSKTRINKMIKIDKKELSPKYKQVLIAGKKFSEVISEFCPEQCLEKVQAFYKIDEAIMWASAAIYAKAIHERDEKTKKKRDGV